MILVIKIWPNSPIQTMAQMSLSAFMLIMVVLFSVLDSCGVVQSGLDRLRCIVSAMILGLLIAGLIWIIEPASMAKTSELIGVIGGGGLLLAAVWLGFSFAYSGASVLVLAFVPALSTVASVVLSVTVATLICVTGWIRQRLARPVDLMNAS